MPDYIVEGRGRDSGRKRKRKYTVANELEARQRAEKDGTTPEAVRLVEATYLIREVAGVSHKNADNTSRQRIIRESRVGDELVLTHETDNRHDVHAIRVTKPDGSQMGYLPSDLAQYVMSWVSSDVGCRYSAHILQIKEVGQREPILLVEMLLVLAFENASSEAIGNVLEAVRTKVKALPPKMDLAPRQVVEIGRRATQQRRSAPAKQGCLAQLLLFVVCAASLCGLALVALL